jgi:hypothetical protein
VGASETIVSPRSSGPTRGHEFLRPARILAAEGRRGLREDSGPDRAERIGHVGLEDHAADRMPD